MGFQVGGFLHYLRGLGEHVGHRVARDSGGLLLRHGTFEEVGEAVEVFPDTGFTQGAAPAVVLPTQLVHSSVQIHRLNALQGAMGTEEFDGGPQVLLCLD